MRALAWVLAPLLTGTAPPAWSLTDDSGASVDIDLPARRIVSLAPHITELVFAAGAGDRLVGVAQYSDYPPRARSIAEVGGYQSLDVETILRLEPDIVIAWQSGNRPQQIEKLRRLGMTVYLSEPRSLEDIAASLRVIGRIAGTPEHARRAAQRFQSRLSKLRERYHGLARLRGFYQVWDQPLITVNGRHIINDAMRLCGIENVFADLPALAPQVSRESVLFKDPQIIVASGADEGRPAWLDRWQRWPQLTAVQAGNVFFIPPALIQRHTPRMIEGIERLCEQASQSRENLAALHRP